MLKAAGDLLAHEGAGALTMRRIADHIGSSTTVLYNLFESKNGILDAMVRAGHEVLRARLEAIPRDLSPFERLVQSARVYRELALEDPARYQFLFGSVIPGYQRTGEATRAAQASFDALAAIVRECQLAAVLTEQADPGFISEILIAAAHGAVSLELSGHFDDPKRADRRFAVLTAASVEPFLPDKPRRSSPRRRAPPPGASR